MKVIVTCIVVVVAALIWFIYRALQIAGKENDDQQQLEYIWELQDKKQKKEKK